MMTNQKIEEIRQHLIKVSALPQAAADALEWAAKERETMARRLGKMEAHVLEVLTENEYLTRHTKLQTERIEQLETELKEARE